MANHYITHNHSLDDLRWVVIEQIDDSMQNPEAILCEKEQRWVYRMNTNSTGLKDDVQWGHFYR